MSRTWNIAILLAFGLTFGFVQENVKVNINFILEQGDRIPGFFEQDAETKAEWLGKCTVFSPLDYYYSHEPIDLLLDFPRHWLVKAKWILTFLFAAVFCAVNGRLMFLATGDRRWHLRFMKGYAVLLAAGFALYLAGMGLGFREEAYAISRKLTGALQSLVPLMVMLPAQYLYTHISQPQSHEKVE
jgi:hypothetical protein